MEVRGPLFRQLLTFIPIYTGGHSSDSSSPAAGSTTSITTRITLAPNQVALTLKCPGDHAVDEYCTPDDEWGCNDCGLR